jgi:copper chaperone
MSLKLSVPSIGCASCIETITKAIHAVDVSAIITGDAPSKSLDIESQLPELKIRELIAIAGHQVAN